MPNAGARPGRPSTRPAPGGGAAADFLQNRPAAGQLPARPGVGDRPGASDRRDNLQDRRGNAGDRRDNLTDRRGDRGDNRQQRREQIGDNRAGRIDNRQQWQDNRATRRDYVQDHMQRYPLRGDFWRAHPRWGRWAINRPYRWATWGTMTTWFAWGTMSPSYYSYGENVYYVDNSVYYGDQEVATADDYAAQAYTITERAAEAPESEEWMPLGVFAVTQDGESSGPPPTMFLQLAVSKQGVIAGTFYDQTTDKSIEVEGAVDKGSQRVAWVGKDKQWPIMETGVSNLTKDAAPALVHFGDGQTQQVLLVRLEDPEEQN